MATENVHTGYANNTWSCDFKGDGVRTNYATNAHVLEWCNWDAKFILLLK